jgi:diacylglycerol kinase family enzyme
VNEVAFVVNPNLIANVARVEKHCVDAALSRGWSPRFVLVEDDRARQDLGRQLARFARPGRSDERLVFAIGGDGTVKACAEAVAGTSVPLAVVARGTGNLFSRALGLPSRLAEALAVGFEGRDAWLDLGTADGAVFTSMAGIGVDAAVVGATPQLFKQHLGWLAYAVGAVPHLSRPPHEMVVRIDGREPVTTRAQCVVVANVGILPGGFAIFPGARMDDGLLDVGVLYPKSVLGWALMARTAVAKGHFADRYFAHFQGTRVEVTATTDLPRQLDGDLMRPGRSLALAVRPGALRARLPL